jgi:hypothetical protein
MYILHFYLVVTDQIIHSCVIYIHIGIYYCVSSSLQIDHCSDIMVEFIKTDSSDISH